MAEQPTTQDELTYYIGQLVLANRKLESERDERQAHIDRALVLLQDEPGMELTRVGIDAVRAALEDDQPTKEIR